MSAEKRINITTLFSLEHSLFNIKGGCSYGCGFGKKWFEQLQGDAPGSTRLQLLQAGQQER